MKKVTKLSYFFVFFAFLIIGWLNLAPPFILILFSYLILSFLKFFNKKFIAVLLFLVLVTIIFYGFAFFVNQSLIALPHIASTSIPMIVDWTKSKGFELPFDDLTGLKALAVDGIKNQLGYLTNFAKLATKDFVFLLIALVVSISIFLNGQLDLDAGKYSVRNNLYSALCIELTSRVTNLYRSFKTVMGAQLLISAINTFFTAIFVFALDLPYGMIVTVITFICGLLPIIGNLISNSIIVAIAITISPKMAISSLVFLIILHKFEYFLNGKIIGERIKNPMWLTLIALILGEKLLGIPGMILAPVIMHYIKIETSQIEI